jgi:hypothetical protein
VPLLGWMLSTEFDDEKTQLIDDGIVTRASFQNHLVFDYNIDMMAFYLISLFVTGLWYNSVGGIFKSLLIHPVRPFFYPVVTIHP